MFKNRMRTIILWALVAVFGYVFGYMSGSGKMNLKQAMAHNSEDCNGFYFANCSYTQESKSWYGEHMYKVTIGHRNHQIYWTPNSGPVNAMSNPITFYLKGNTPSVPNKPSEDGGTDIFGNPKGSGYQY